MNQHTKTSFLAKVMILIVKGYQYLLSPMLGSNCRLFPTCSSYTIEAIKLHGALKGFVLGFWRIVRCNPFSKGGYEPVPGSCEHKKWLAQKDKSN